MSIFFLIPNICGLSDNQASPSTFVFLLSLLFTKLKKKSVTEWNKMNASYCIHFINMSFFKLSWSIYFDVQHLTLEGQSVLIEFKKLLDSVWHWTGIWFSNVRMSLLMDHLRFIYKHGKLPGPISIHIYGIWDCKDFWTVWYWTKNIILENVRLSLTDSVKELTDIKLLP
jgi:hypothetical protein